MWNGYDCREVIGRRAEMRHREDQEQDGRPRVLLDVARYKASIRSIRLRITNEDLYNTGEEAEPHAQARRLRHRAHRHDGALPEGRKLDGYRAASAGFAFETLDFVKQTELAALASDTWGCEVARTRRGRHQPAVALDHHPDHGHDHGRDLRAQEWPTIAWPTRSTILFVAPAIRSPGGWLTSIRGDQVTVSLAVPGAASMARRTAHDPNRP